VLEEKEWEVNEVAIPFLRSFIDLFKMLSMEEKVLSPFRIQLHKSNLSFFYLFVCNVATAYLYTASYLMKERGGVVSG